ncbi:MAG TPA: hypothetical protein EYP17_04285, partial [Candidatus Latescibacteria bacterium]|nr:hypothetical protein [Candidatus Latescibacterota bacterium]
MRRRVLTPLAILAGIVVVFVGMRHFCRARERRLRALFVGPYETSVTTEQVYYPRCSYDLEEYSRYAGGYPLPEAVPLPGKKPELRLKWVEEIEGVEAVTAATMPIEDRLRWRSVYRERIPSKSLQISYPPYGAVFPPNFCEPEVEWEDDVNDLWQVTVGVSGTSLKRSFITDERLWWFPRKLWMTLREKAMEGDIWVQVKGIRRTGRYGRKGGIQASPVVRLRISSDPVDDYVVYRLVAPQFQTLETPDTFIRDIRSFEVRPFLSARGKYCFSCHTFSSKAGAEGMMSIKVYFMAAEGAPPSALGLFDMSSGKGQKVKVPYPKGFTYMAWDSKGEKLAISVNQSFASSTPIIHETQELRFQSSDIAVYEPSEGVFRLLPGADLPEYVENFPSWSPDGRRLLFSRTRPGLSARLVKYDVYALDYNDGRGGTPVPVP